MLKLTFKKTSTRVATALALTVLFASPAMALDLTMRVQDVPESWIGFTSHSECYYDSGCDLFADDCNGYRVLADYKTVETLKRYYYQGKAVWIFGDGRELCKFKQ